MNWKTTNDIAFAIAVETTQAVNTAKAMIRDAEVAAAAKRTAEKHTHCRACQAELENFLIDFPDASEDATLCQLQDAWETCGTCKAEYQAWIDSQAERHEQQSRGLDYAEELNGTPMHEKVNGNGGAK